MAAEVEAGFLAAEVEVVFFAPLASSRDFWVTPVALAMALSWASVGTYRARSALLMSLAVRPFFAAFASCSWVSDAAARASLSRVDRVDMKEASFFIFDGTNIRLCAQPPENYLFLPGIVSLFSAPGNRREAN